jgi:hypothetical protein
LARLLLPPTPSITPDNTNCNHQRYVYNNNICVNNNTTCTQHTSYTMHLYYIILLLYYASYYTHRLRRSTIIIILSRRVVLFEMDNNNNTICDRRTVLIKTTLVFPFCCIISLCRVFFSLKIFRLTRFLYPSLLIFCPTTNNNT